MKYRWSVWLDGIPLAAVLLLVLLGLNRLSTPDPGQIPLLLDYTDGNSNGWCFETEEGPAVPELGFGGYFQGIAAEAEGPVAASRVMEDPGMRNLLEFSYYGAGIQVFLDEELLYTDFPNAENRPDTFLTDVAVSDLGQDTLHISLPFDCAGKTLRVVTYGPLWDGYRPVIFPSLVSRFSDAVIMTADVAWDLAQATALCILSGILLLVFLLGEQTAQRQWKLLPLAAYFLLSAVPVLRRSFAATAAGLDGTYPWLDWTSLICIDFLILFLAMDVRGWRRWALLAGCGTHVLLSSLQALRGASAFPEGFMQDPAGLVLIALAVLVMFSDKKRKLYRYAGICAAVSVLIPFAAWAISHFCGLDKLYPLANPANAILQGDFRSIYRIISAVISAVCAVGVIIEFIQNILIRQKQEQTILLRARMAQESYAQARDSIQRTAVMRHEWKNQIASLHLLLRQGKTDELARSLQQMDANLEQLVPHHYSEHFTINTILQSTAARAEKLGVRFTASAPVPHELSVDEADLCSLLLNMLDNALEAAAAVADSEKREIDCAIRFRQGYLTVKCENSYAGPLKFDSHGGMLTTKADADIHGYGLIQMKTIAERYGSVLDVSHTDDRFIIQTALKIN